MPVLPDDSPITPSGGVQPWTTVEDICPPCNDYGFDEALLEDCIQFASEVLFEFTARRWPGEIQDVVRPCGMRTTVGWGRYEFAVGELVGWCGCQSPRACGCRRLSEIKLPGASFGVVSVDEVKIDGIVIDPDRYRLDDSGWLVYLPDETGLDPRTGWPCCQRLDRADTEDDTFSVTYTYGQFPDRGGQMAAASLACQLAIAFGGGASTTSCRLPKRVTQITRQGVTIAVLDPLTLFAGGQTGLPEVDMWIGSKKIGAKTRRATAMRIGQGRSVRRTGN